MKKEKWLVAAKKADFNEWANVYHISPVLARIIRNRDVTEPEQVGKYLHGTMEDCHSPWLLHGMEQAVELIRNQIKDGIKIRVIGDYDVDGICSSYILTEGLKRMGADVDTAIPHRIRDGYGLNEQLIQEAQQAGVGCIVTCDNGIAATEQVALAKALGMMVIVTDHHEVPFEETAGCEGVSGSEEVYTFKSHVPRKGSRKEILPPADVIIDPKQEACGYPFKSICGGVVAYKLMQALRERTEFMEESDFRKDFLPFAALATVCDVMELKDENRIVVKEGLKQFSTTKNLGLQALIQVNQLDVSTLNAYHLGFVMGPCLNATGRLDTAKRALELLQSSTKVEAMTAATELKQLNDSRKNLTLQGLQEAEEKIIQEEIYKDKIMLVYLPQVHESLAGIIAGRIREHYYHPVFVLTDSEDGIKGSGRSIESYHMFERLTAVKEYLTKFGGHKLAAGLSLKKENLEDLKKALNDKADLAEEDFAPTVHIDVPMPMSYASLEFARELQLLEPFGVGNPKPLFAQKDVVFVGAKRIGASGNYARFCVLVEHGNSYGREANFTRGGDYRREDLMYFGDLDGFCSFLDEKYGGGSAEALFAGGAEFQVSITYQVGVNSFRGRDTLQYIMQNYA